MKAESSPVLIIGSRGQVARSLDAVKSSPHVALGRDVADLCRSDSLRRAFAEYTPALVINAGAYTAVDKAESETTFAFQVNRDGPARLATLCAEYGIPLIHLSTDYVFDGMKETPYLEDDPVAPLNAYGISKAEGEAVIRNMLDKHVILRTSWIYSPYGNNFVKTMLRLGGEREELAVVDDQFGSPTSALDIARAIGVISTRILNGSALYGTFHLAGCGSTTWYGFSREIFSQAAARGRKAPSIRPISSSDYPTPAKRPRNSQLDCSKIRQAYGIALPPWQDALPICLDELFQNSPQEGLS